MSLLGKEDSVNRFSRVLLAASMVVLSSTALAASSSDAKPIIHTLRAVNTHPYSAPTVASGWTRVGKPVEWNRPAPKSFLPPAGPPDPYRGQKLIMHTLRALNVHA
jgi:hypothetical protein